MKGKKRHRRAKGKKKKQKSSLLITHEEGEGGASSLSHLQERNITLVHTELVDHSAWSI
jgi:hypothetical protein